LVIVGPGAVGCLFASFFASSGKEVWILDKDAERAEHLNENGITVEKSGVDKTFPVKATADASQIGEADAVFICVKAPDTRAAAEAARPAVGDDTVVATLQNGLGNVERIAGAVGKEHVIGGTTAQGATLLGVGRVRHAGEGETVIGEIDGNITPRLERLRDLMRECGVRTDLTENLEGLLWSKLVINVGINALTALVRMRNGKLVEHEGARKVMKAAVEEALAVVDKMGIKLLFDNPVAKVEDVCRATAANISSMLQDVLRARRTEVDYINGAVAARAAELGIPAPVNETLANLVKTIEASYREQILSV